MEKSKLFLYLGKRDKKGIKLLSIFDNQTILPPTRIKNLYELNLPAALSEEISNTIYVERMLWEPWIQSAKSYQELKKALRDQGFSNVPIHDSPKHMHIVKPVVTNKDKKEIINLTVNKLISNKKTMLRRR